MSPRARAAAQAAAVLVVAGVLLAVVLPRSVGTSFGSVAQAAGQLGALQFAGLVVLWLAGLWAHTWVATAALPRLTHRQALAINLTGSAASNLAPFGGPLGVGVGWAMARSWGHKAVPFGAFTAVVNLCNILVKLALPVVGIALLLASGAHLPAGLAGAGAVGALVLALLVGALVAGLLSEAAAHRLARSLDRLVRRLLPRRRDAPSLAGPVLETRAAVLSLVAAGWHRMLAGSFAYVLLQAALLHAVLQMLGSDLGPVPVFAGFAVGRLVSLAPVTPGGVGVAETGTAAVLVALGGAPDVVAAATLVYAGVTYAMEIPVGGVVGALWWWQRRRAAALQGAAA